MFWKLSALSATSPVESILDKDNFTLEELLDEEDIIQECKALNSRLVNFLRERSQVEQLLRYIVEEPPEDADSKRSFKFPFIASEIFTCEIDVILKTLVEEEELMDLLFSFLDPNRPHSALLAGYFSKVIVCLMLRKTVPLMNYVQEHRDVLHQLVDLIGITSIMEVLVRLVGADDHIYPNFMDVMQWLADSNLLEMIIDKLSPTSTPEVHANAAETLCAITRNAPSALATKLASPSFVERVFNHALEDSHSKSGLVHSLSVCISLLDPRRATFSSPLFHSFRSQNMFESPIIVDPETISAMLPKLGDLLMLLNVSSDQNMLPTTYGELRPPLGKHRLKIVEFIAVLMRTCNEGAERELINSGAIRRVVDLFFEYGFNNALHHQVESIITSCLESKNENIVRHLFEDCNLLGQILNAERHPVISADLNQPTLPAPSKQAPRAGNIGHITRISNKLVQLSSNSSQIRDFLQGNTEWGEWQANVLQNRNAVENVYRWTCGRPTALQGTRDSDDDDLHDRDYDVAGLSNNLSGDYDVAALANNLSQAFRYKIYGNEEAEEDPGSLDRDDEDVYFDDESAEVVISSLRFGDDQGSSLFTNSNWFAFQDERMEDAPAAEASSSSEMDDINLNNESGGNISKDDDDEVVVGEDEELLWPGTKQPPKATSSDPSNDVQQSEEDPSTDRSDSDVQVGGSNPNPLTNLPEEAPKDGESFPLPNGLSTTETTTTSTAVPSMFEEDVEFVGVEVEGTEKAMEHALKEEGIVVGEAGPMKKELSTPDGAHDDEEGQVGKELNDTNCWRPTTDHEVAVSE